MVVMSAKSFVRMNVPVFLRIAPISFSRSVMTRRIIVVTIFDEPNLHGNVESISHSCISSSDRDELAWEEVVMGQDTRNSLAVSSAPSLFLHFCRSYWF